MRLCSTNECTQKSICVNFDIIGGVICDIGSITFQKSAKLECWLYWGLMPL